MNLPKSEEQLMQILWQKEKAFMKDITEAYPEPKPKATTIATLLKRLLTKEAIGFTQFGNVRQYYPILKKEDYFSSHFNGMIKNFFDDSIPQFASFFTSNKNMTEEQLLELKRVVEEQIKARKK
ncbi:MAG: BlaI/MecI/CopY family transcriptional regulator [Roseivirga sp.]|nr:BlaI/MecI/CopY family transcriptional regulator [Roseivirga sp.]